MADNLTKYEAINSEENNFTMRELSHSPKVVNRFSQNDASRFKGLHYVITAQFVNFSLPLKLMFPI